MARLPFPELAICNGSYRGALRRSCQNGMGKQRLQIPQILSPKAAGPGVEQGESGGRTGFISLMMQPRRSAIWENTAELSICRVCSLAIPLPLRKWLKMVSPSPRCPWAQGCPSQWRWWRQGPRQPWGVEGACLPLGVQRQDSAAVASDTLGCAPSDKNGSG